MKNGPGGPIPFPARSDVPIVGQPFALKSCFLTVSIVCNCGAHEPVLIVGGATASCPACRRGFLVQAATLNAQTGQMQVGIAVVASPQEAASMETPS